MTTYLMGDRRSNYDDLIRAISRNGLCGVRII